MIKVPSGEGVAFDILSVLWIKQQKNSQNLIALRNYTFYRDAIIDEIGFPLSKAIRQSKEYEDLIIVNTELFNLIDYLKIKQDYECFDKKIDELNFRRSELKVALQKKFFPDSGSIEQKFGYEKSVLTGTPKSS